jgi:hypothetical protein
MEPLVEFGLVAGFAYVLLVVLFYFTAAIHFGHVSRWMQTSQQRLDAMQLELNLTKLRFMAKEEEEEEWEPEEEYEMAG